MGSLPKFKPVAFKLAYEPFYKHAFGVSCSRIGLNRSSSLEFIVDPSHHSRFLCGVHHCSQFRQGRLYRSRSRSTTIKSRSGYSPHHCSLSNNVSVVNMTHLHPMNKLLRLSMENLEFGTERPNNGLGKVFSETVQACVPCLQKGGVIAVPTDTIYGIAGLAQDTEAVNRIYEIKKRNYQKPIAISVASIDDIYRWSRVTVERQLLMDLLPGPVTVVFVRQAELNPALNPDTPLIGIRIPDHKFMQNLAQECCGPIALTSANISGASSCLHVQEFEALWPSLDLIVNGGTLNDTEESRLGSTVVDLSMPGTFHIIRPGSAYEATRKCLEEKHRLKERSSQS